jgi:hypothetical protein
MPGVLIFEIPVYRTSSDEWGKERDEEIERDIRPRKRPRLVGRKDPTPEDIEDARRRASLMGDTRPRTYNDVVGWIRVEAEGMGGIKAYGWRVSHGRIVRGFGMTYEYADKLLDLGFFGEETADEIASRVRDTLTKLTGKEGAFAGRTLALEAFDHVAPHMDWRALLGMRPQAP